MGPTGTRVLNTTTLPDLQRPDTISVDTKQLFGENAIAEDQEGLFVFVRDGHIEVSTAREVLHLGKGEAGFAGDQGNTARPTTIPRFLDFDRVPLPNSKNPMLATVLGETGIRLTNQCR